MVDYYKRLRSGIVAEVLLCLGLGHGNNLIS